MSRDWIYNFEKNLNLEDSCLHCYVYYIDRKQIFEKHKDKYKNLEEVFPISYVCPNKDCNTLNYDSDTESTDEEHFSPNTNWDNWDIEPNVKVRKQKTYKKPVQILSNLFNQLNLTKSDKIGKKKKSLKINSDEIEQLFKKININKN